VAVSVVFPGAGSASDPKGREGTAELASDVFLGGTRTKSARELAVALDDLAAILEVSAGSDSSVARLFVLEPDLDASLALLARSSRNRRSPWRSSRRAAAGCSTR